MNQRHLIAAAATSLMSLALLSSPAMAQNSGKEKCFGIAKAGQNDCANNCCQQNKRKCPEWQQVRTKNLIGDFLGRNYLGRLRQFFISERSSQR